MHEVLNMDWEWQESSNTVKQTNTEENTEDEDQRVGIQRQIFI